MRRTKGTSVDPIFVLDSATLRRTKGTSVDPIFFCWTLLRCEGRKAPASTQYLFLTRLRCAGREAPASTQYLFWLCYVAKDERHQRRPIFFVDSCALCTRSTSLEQSCGTAISRTWGSAHQADESFYRFSLCQVPHIFFSLAPDAVNYGGSKCPCAWIKVIPRKHRWIKVAKLVDQSFASQNTVDQSDPRF